MPAILEDEMTRRDTMPVRLGNEAIEAAKIAASLRGMTLTDYATSVLLEAGEPRHRRVCQSAGQGVPGGG